MLYKLKDMKLTVQNPCLKLGAVSYAYNLSTGVAQDRMACWLANLGIWVMYRFSERPCSKYRMESDWNIILEDNLILTSGFYMLMHTTVHTDALTQYLYY